MLVAASSLTVRNVCCSQVSCLVLSSFLVHPDLSLVADLHFLSAGLQLWYWMTVHSTVGLASDEQNVSVSVVAVFLCKAAGMYLFYVSFINLFMTTSVENTRTVKYCSVEVSQTHFTFHFVVDIS